MSNRDFKTFWGILSEIGIEIPAIQRDYAQGRETGRIPVIRKKFIGSILKNLEINEKEPLRLDFVYGKIHGEKNEEELRKNTSAIKSLLDNIKDYANSIDLLIEETTVTVKSNEKGELVYLIPLDGQQRLTALFLIHWFVIRKLNLLNQLEVLKRFRYKTRKSSDLFLEMLCDEGNSFDFNSSIKDTLVDHEKFSNTWLDDPTVQSMLNVLEEISNLCADYSIEDYSTIWRNLTEKQSVFFDFLNLKDFNLSDDLYVKMNARGKQLSDFENFKAWLFGKIENETWYPKDKWNLESFKFDVEWTDIFWHSKSENSYEIDDAYFNYFKIQYLIDLVKRAEVEKSAFKDGENKNIIESIISNDFDFDFESSYGELFFQNLENYFRLLEISSRNELMNDESYVLRSYFQFFFNCGNSIIWVDLIKNYIVSQYLSVNTEEDVKKKHFNSYLRVLSNLVNNQTFDNASLYKKALIDIDKVNYYLKTNQCDIFDWLKSLKDNRDLVFTEEQIAEEIEKAELLFNDLEPDSISWLTLLEKAEMHPYFNGKIWFLLKLAEKDKDKFKFYFDSISPLFEDEVLFDPEYIFQRALLTQGNYFIGKGNDKVSFCKNDKVSYRDRRENWLQFLNDEEKINLLLNIIKSPFYKLENVSKSLKDIINFYEQENPINNILLEKFSSLDYSKLYIYCYELFNYGTSRLIQLYKGKFAYQLNATTSGGYFSDIICEFIKIKFFSISKSVIAHKAKGWDNSPSLTYNNETFIFLDSDEEVFILDDGGREKFINMKEVINHIQQKL